MSAATEFDAYARSYDLIYRDKDYDAEAAFVHRRLQQARPGVQQVLELGCGTGHHAASLAALGYDVHGVDLSPGMLSSAEARRAALPEALAAKLHFEAGDVRNLRVGRQFDAAVSLFHVMSYQTTDDDLAHALASAARHLPVGGVLLFDFWYGPAVLLDPPAVRVKRMEDEHVHVTRLAEPLMHVDRDVVEVRYQLFVRDKKSQRVEQLQESHSLRYWFWPELQRHLRAAGLRDLGLWAWMSDVPAGPRDWLAYTVCQRTDDPAPA